MVWEKKQSWKYKECFFPVGVWYTEVIPCSSHNPHNLLQEQQQNNWADCKFLSGLQIWKDEEQGEKPPLFHSQEQSHSKENTVKWTNLQDSCFSFFHQEMSLARVKRYRFFNSKFNSRCNTQRFFPLHLKKGAEILQMVAGSLNTTWYKKHTKNDQILKLCLPLSKARLSWSICWQVKLGIFPYCY